MQFVACSSCGAKYRRSFQRRFGPTVIPAPQEQPNTQSASDRPRKRKLPGYLIKKPKKREDPVIPVDLSGVVEAPLITAENVPLEQNTQTFDPVGSLDANLVESIE